VYRKEKRKKREIERMAMKRRVSLLGDLVHRKEKGEQKKSTQTVILFFLDDDLRAFSWLSADDFSRERPENGGRSGLGQVVNGRGGSRFVDSGDFLGWWVSRGRLPFPGFFSPLFPFPSGVFSTLLRFPSRVFSTLPSLPAGFFSPLFSFPSGSFFSHAGRFNRFRTLADCRTWGHRLLYHLRWSPDTSRSRSCPLTSC
jgi:hypothetical protein